MAAKQLSSCAAVKKFSINYVRDGLVEEFHTGIIQYGIKGDDLTPYYLRSCAKPLQASLLIDYDIDFTPKELAFCSGSHAGEECHVKTAQGILNKLGLDEKFLKCGIHPPLSRTMQDKMLLKGEKPSAIHNNCSGKHLGFLAICKKQGWDLDTYYEPNHPLQIEVKRKIYELCEIMPPHPSPLPQGEGELDYPMTTDGCGVPIVSMPLKNLVIGYKNFTEKYPKLVSAIMNNPYIYGGENRLDTEIMQNSEGLIAKVGAGGLCIVYNTKLNEGFAVKMNDANMEARRFAVIEMLNELNWAKIDIDKSIKTLSGKIVGQINAEY